MLFLHISDIHFNKDHVGHPDDPNLALRNELIRDVKRKKDGIGRRADGILLCGDIAFGGHPTEYEFALNWLKTDLCPAAGCELRDVFVIPGNHDVDRRAAIAPVQKSARQHLRDVPLNKLDELLGQFMRDPDSAKALFGPIENYNRFAFTFWCSLGGYVQANKEEATRPFAQRNLVLNDQSTLRLWGFNSVLVSDKFDIEAPPNMIVDPAATQIERISGVTNMVLCHHPFNWLRNGPKFQDRIDAAAQIHLFGHEHTRRVEINQDFVRIRAGAVQPERDAAEWKPGYNWIDLEVEGTGDNRFLKVSIWVRLYDDRPPQFLAVPDKHGNDPWTAKIRLDVWKPSAHEEPMANPLDRPVDPSNPPALDVRNVAMGISRLRVDELEACMRSVGLDEANDRDLKDYELGVAAVQRAVERGKLKEFHEAVQKVSR